MIHISCLINTCRNDSVNELVQTLEVIKVHQDGAIKTIIDFDGAEGGQDLR